MLSKKSMEFLENLTVYLLSSGKDEKEVNEIVEELRDHLTIAEAEGKNIEQIIGQSPKKYMAQISQEMPMNKKSVVQTVALIATGVLSFSVIQNSIAGDFTYSLLKVIGTFTLVTLFVILISMLFKKIATSNKRMTGSIIAIGVLPIIAFIGLLVLDDNISSPSITFSATVGWLIAASALLFLLAMSIWSKTYVALFFLVALTLPDFVLAQLSLKPEQAAPISLIATITLIAIYLRVTNQKLKNDRV